MPNSLILPVDWSQVVNYKPDDFKHPEKLDFTLILGLDRLATILGVKAFILSDYRIGALAPSGKPSQHSLGRAVDFTYPGVDSIRVLDTIRDMKWFSGYGMYINEQTLGVSFHVDTRTDRVPEKPAVWGASKDPRKAQKGWIYTSLQSIVNKYLKNSLPSLLLLGLAGVVWYCLTQQT